MVYFHMIDSMAAYVTLPQRVHRKFVTLLLRGTSCVLFWTTTVGKGCCSGVRAIHHCLAEIRE